MKRGRFIAGAACRACGASDRIVVEEREGIRIQRCVACRHEESFDASSNENGIPSGDESATIVRIVPQSRRE